MFHSDLYNKFVLILVGLLPLTLVVGTMISELLIFTIIFFFLSEILIKKKFEFFKDDIFLFLCVIWIYLLLNLINSTNFEHSLLRSIFFIRFPLLVIAINFFLKKNSYNFDLIFKLWGITLAIVIIDLYFQAIFGFNTIGFKSPWTGRLSGFLNEELKIAHILIGFVMPTICFYIPKTKNKIYILVLIFLYILILLLINERSNALKGFIVVFGLFIFYEKFNFKKKIFSIAMIALTITLVLSFNKNLNQRFVREIVSMDIKEKTLFNYIKYSNYGPHYLASLKIFKKYPIFGSGIKTFRIECNNVDIKNYYTTTHPKVQKKKDLLYNNKCNTHPHQIYFEILSELGLIGFLLFFSFFFYLIYKSTRCYLNNKNKILLSSLLFIFAQIIPLLPSGSFFTNFGATIFWINVSIIYSINKKYEKSIS